MQIILIGNYPKDKQESMLRFAKMLQQGFEAAGIACSTWFPNIIFGRLVESTLNGKGKWLGYIDKYILYPIILRFRTRLYDSNETIFHICDHSNAIYLPHIYGKKKGITCHDVLAIRGALGYSDAFCEASTFGRILQKWILKNLAAAANLGAVSQLTLNQLIELKPPTKDSNWRVIPNSFNASFSKIPNKFIEEVLEESPIASKPYLLHVGSSLPRKNRVLLLDMVAALVGKWDGNICFAGQPLEKELTDKAAILGLSSRIISVIKPDHNTLVMLYSNCEAFVFPSFSEGFGWPVIEAQACGVPVIASSIEPMPEVSGGAALHVSPYNPNGFAEAFLELNDASFRSNLIDKGYQNVKRFELGKMIEKYIALYNN